MDSSLLGLDGKSAMVVGGGQGMGESTAKFLARAGCGVAVVDVVKERADRVAGAVQELGQRTVSIEGDVLEDSQVKVVVEKAKQGLGDLDIMVSIVGQASWNPILDMTTEQWELDHRRNLRYFFLIARAVARDLIDQGKPGAMVCIASVSGIQSAPNHASYGAAKAGLMNLVRTMAVEWSSYKIRVNAIAPGGIITPRIPETAETVERSRHGLVPMKRRGTTDEIAKAALFLVSDLASYVTGHTLPVDGGWMAAFLSGVPHSPGDSVTQV